MPAYKVFHPDHEVIGQNLIDIANAIDSERFLPLFEEYGFTNIDPIRWYPFQDVLDVLSTIATFEGHMFDFVSLGMNSAAAAAIPPEFEQASFVEILYASPDVYRFNHRGTDVGDIVIEKLGKQHIRGTYRTPLPDDLWYGSVYGFVKRFAPKGTHFTVRYDENVTRRDHGGEVTVLHVEWS